ncbi:aldo/keto reductase [Streptomyces sp. WMMC897]|uniref:aldo/keto reductase n=1 Tax=Streptomyces sp. WMMC897 TaxID=3014782 RepID=UPI003FCCA0EB
MERNELLQLHRIDPNTPLAEFLGALGDLKAEGKVGHIGLSEVTTEELAKVRASVDIASVQSLALSSSSDVACR